MKTKIYLLQIFLLAAVFAACNKDENDLENASISMRLTDAPAAYDAVYVDIQGMEVHINGEEESGWYVLDDINPGVYNLLDFRNGLDTLFAEGEVPPGDMNEIRLILGTNNSVVKDGAQFELKTPSAQQSGLKLKVQQDLDPGLKYEFWIDFDAERSVVEKGNGTFNLKPVIRLFAENTTGSVKGYVWPVEADPFIMAYNAAGDTISGRPDSISGYFLLFGMPPASYTVHFDADSAFTDQTVNSVQVNTGQVYNMDTINF